MTAVKRLEIVIDAPYAERVTRLLTRHGVDGWTVLRGASGLGERGHRYGDDVTGVSNNNLIISVCSPGQLDALVVDLRSVLKVCGGVCLISDAEWLSH